QKLVLVGDCACGKTPLLRALLRGQASSDPVQFDHCPDDYQCLVKTDTDEVKLVRLALWDTAGAFEYNRLEPLKYPDSHAILISFAAVDALRSFENLEEKARLTI
ncbi:hypothetical protein B0T10DRAFT_416380, partial [Thelonectria olida]